MRRRHVVVVAAILVALTAAVVILAQLNRSDADVASGSVAVTRGGKTIATFTMDQVKEMRSVTREKTIQSSNHPDETGTFTGVPLRELLAQADPKLLDEAEMVVTRATDGYVSSLSPEEVADGDEVVLCYAKDDQSLGTYDGGGTGPFRLIIFSDKFGQRFTKWLNEIEIR